LILLVTLTLAACAPRASTILSPQEGAAYAAEVDDIVENVLVSFSENDYARYTRDMDEGYVKDMKSSLMQVADVISAEFGAYQVKTLDHVEGRQMRQIVVYHLAFEKKPDVILEVYFNIFDSKRIVGTYWEYE